MKHYSLITLILISMATAGVVTVEAGHKTHRRIVCYHCATTGMTAGYGGQVIDSFKVFVSDDKVAPAKDVYLIGPDGTKVQPDDDGIATVPNGWDQKVVSVRDSGGRELGTVRLSASDDEMFRVKAAGASAGGKDADSQIDEADTPTTSTDLPTCTAVERRLLLKDAIARLKKNRQRLGLDGDFDSEVNLPDGATDACPPADGSSAGTDDSGSQVEDI